MILSKIDEVANFLQSYRLCSTILIPDSIHHNYRVNVRCLFCIKHLHAFSKKCIFTARLHSIFKRCETIETIDQWFSTFFRTATQDDLTTLFQNMCSKMQLCTRNNNTNTSKNKAKVMYERFQ